MPGEELFTYYGRAYAWKKDEYKSAPTHQDTIVSGSGEAEVKLPRPSSDLTPLEIKQDTEQKAQNPSLRTKLETGHMDFEEDSLVLYDGGEVAPWLVGQVLSVDSSRPFLEVHRFGSLDFLKSKEISTCKFRPAYVDPKDGKQVFTHSALGRYKPVLDIIEFSDVVMRDFFITNNGKLPDSVVRAITDLSVRGTY